MRQVPRSRDHDQPNLDTRVDRALERVRQLERRSREAVEEREHFLAETPQRRARELTVRIVIDDANDAAPVVGADPRLAPARRLTRSRGERARGAAPCG